MVLSRVTNQLQAEIMYQVSIKQISKKDHPDMASYTYVAKIFEDGQQVEETEFYGAEVHTDKVRAVTGSGVRIAMRKGSAVSSGATEVTGDMIDAFAEMQSGDDGQVIVETKKSAWEGAIDFQEN